MKLNVFILISQIKHNLNDSLLVINIHGLSEKEIRLITEKWGHREVTLSQCPMRFSKRPPLLT